MDKLQKIKDLYAEDKLINNRPDYSLNEFLGTIQIGLKDIENKSLKVTKDPNMKYVVYDGNKELGYLDNSKGTVFYDDNMYGRFNSIRQSAKRDPEKKQEISFTLSNPNMSYFPIEEIEFTEEERNEIFRNVRGRMSSMVAKYYKEIYGDNLISIEFNNNTIPINFNGKNDENDFNRILKVEFHSSFNKFGLALAKLALEGELKDRDDLIDFKAALLQMIDQEGEDNVDETLNGMSVQQIIEKYGLSLATEEDAMINRIFNMERKKGTYKIVKIENFNQAAQYKKYFFPPYVTDSQRPGAWCVTSAERNFTSYVRPDKAELFYFLLREPDWNEKKSVPTYEKRDVFDEYGTSMIAVSIRPDGMVNEGVSRYNHDVKYKKKARLSSTDHSFNEEEISNLLGAPIFELLPSSNPVKSRSEDNSQEVIKKGTKVLTSGDASRQMYLHQGNYYLIIEGSVFKDRRTNKLFEFSSVKKIKRKSDGSVAGYLFYYTIKDRNKANSFVMGFDKNLKMIIPAKEIDREESNPKTLARAVLASTALEEE